MNTFFRVRNKLIMSFKSVRTIHLTMAIDDAKMSHGSRNSFYRPRRNSPSISAAVCRAAIGEIRVKAI